LLIDKMGKLSFDNLILSRVAAVVFFGFKKILAK